MTQFSVRRFSTFVSTRPTLCAALAVLLTLASVVGIWARLTIEMDMSELLPADSEAARNHQAALSDFGHNFDFMLVVLEAPPGNEEMLKRAGDMLADYLEDPRFIREVTKGITPESLELDTRQGKARVISLLSQADWEVIESMLTEDHIRRQVVDLRSKLNAVPSLNEAQRERLLQDPLNILRVLAERVKIKSGPLKLRANLRDQYFMSADGEMLLLLAWPSEAATDLRFAQNLKNFLEETRAGFYIRNPEFGSPNDPAARQVQINFFGPHWEAIADTELVKGDFYRTSIASFLAVICLFFFAFRRPEALIFVAVPLILGVVWTLGLTSLLIGRLTQVTFVFSAILIGLGIDFSVHLYNRYLEEVRLGRENLLAVQAAVVETGPGIIAGALTTAIAFFGMMTTSFVGFRELGLVAGLGVLSCLSAVLLVLPAILVWFGGGPVGEFARRPMSTFGLRKFHFTVMHYPRATLMVGLVVCGVLGYQGRSIVFEDDFRSLKQPSEEYVQLRERIMKHFQVPSNQLVVIVEGESRQAALEANDQLFRNIYAAELSGYRLMAVDSLSHYVPSAATQRVQLERMGRLNIEEVRTRILRVAAEQNIAPWVFDDFISLLRSYHEAAVLARREDRAPIDLDRLDSSLPDAETRKLNRIAKAYIYQPSETQCRIVTKIYPPADSEHKWLSEVPVPFKAALGNGIDKPPVITGSVVIQEELRRLIIDDLARTVLVVLVAVFVYLLIYFESLRKALFAVFPVVMALMAMLGAIVVLGLELHYINIISLPMVVGIGVDSGIHLLQRYYESDKKDMMTTITRTGRAVIITGLTTMIGFGSLSLAHFRGIRELGFFSILGVAFTLFTALLLLPAVLRLTEKTGFQPQGATEDIG
ncbi:MAG: MMPL family transporter [Candidatus Sumerlaeia bacterium]|nr:MMPL family transporter [Candidatus Sumerlaeia bacterium]